MWKNYKYSNIFEIKFCAKDVILLINAPIFNNFYLDLEKD